MNEAEVRRIAGKERVPVGMIEKDYVLSLMLILLVNDAHSSKIVFKGGTAIKKIYFPEARFSEDLDFDYFDINPEGLKALITRLIEKNPFESVSFIGITDEHETETSFTCRVKYKGPLDYDNSIKFDFSGRGGKLTKIAYRPLIDNYDSFEEIICQYLIHKAGKKHLDGTLNRYTCELKGKILTCLDECLACSMFLSGGTVQHLNGLQVLSIEEMLAEKCRALMMRPAPRDLYDIWFLLGKEVKFDRSLVKMKLEDYKETWTINAFENKMEELEVLWSRDLGNLISEIPDFEIVSRYVNEHLEF